jgi:hypothetical protein
MRPKVPLVAVAMTLLACSYHDDPHGRSTRALVLDEIDQSTRRIVLHPPSCPDTRVVLAWSAPDQRQSSTDVRCLTKLATGSTVEFVHQRIRQGCMPGSVYRKQLGPCEVGVVESTEGAPCATDQTRQVGTPD